MDTANLFSAGPLVWTQPKTLRREYQLARGEELVGWLRFEKSFGSLASAEVASQGWTFKREGFFHPRATVRTPGSDANLAVFRPNWSGTGAVEFSGGRMIRWHRTGFWKSGWSFLERDDRPLLHFKQHTGLMKISALLESESPTEPELPLLAALGWYLLLLNAEDESAAVVAAVG